jgi:hypothetical protein
MCHDPYLPSSPASLQALDRMGYAMVNAIAPPDVRIVGPHIVVSSYSPSVPGHKQKFDPGLLRLPNYSRPDPARLRAPIGSW